MARQVFEREGPALKGARALDLCAGCGVVGLDLLVHCQKELRAYPAHVDFIEVQEVYRSHFNLNVQRSQSSTAVRWLTRNYADLQLAEFAHTYDLILCNPPYFEQGMGRLSPSDFKNRCRFLLDCDFSTLIAGLVHALQPKGRAYLLLRDLDAHGRDRWQELQRELPAERRAEVVADIRGTALVCIR
jgi:tRNA1Val (adenine37-N6)-methyltransferase